MGLMGWWLCMSFSIWVRSSIFAAWSDVMLLRLVISDRASNLQEKGETVAKKCRKAHTQLSARGFALQSSNLHQRYANTCMQQ
jgi:hypothetical protein